MHNKLYEEKMTPKEKTNEIETNETKELSYQTMKEEKTKELPALTGELVAVDKSIVVPGEVLATGMSYLPASGCYRQGDNVLASMLGMLTVEGKVLKIIALSGRYIPRIGDTIVAKVIDVLISGWRLEFGAPYSGVLSVKDGTSEFVERGADMTRYFNIGDYVVTKIMNMTSQKLVDLTMRGQGMRKLHDGRLIEVNPHKIPRIIGKEASMISMIKFATGCNIAVGQNGMIWIEGAPEKEILAVKAIKKIEAEAHNPGLTDRIKAFLEKESGLSMAAMPPEIAEEFKPREMDSQREYRPRPQGRFGGGGGFRGPPRGGGFRREGPGNFRREGGY
jgi:exosome complex component RRP4